MPSHNLQIFTILAANLMVYAPAVLGQGIPGLPDLSSLNLPDLTGLDKCAVTCSMSSYASAMQACPVMTDIACFCKNQDFIRASKACMAANCPLSFLPQAAFFAAKTCASVGVTPSPITSADPLPAVPAVNITTPAVKETLNSITAPVTTIATAAVSQAPVLPSVAPIIPPVQAPIQASIQASTPAAIQAPTQNPIVVNTPTAPVDVSRYTFDKTVANKAQVSQNKPATSSQSNQNGLTTSQPYGTQDSFNSTESSASSSVRAAGLFMIGTPLAIMVML